MNKAERNALRRLNETWETLDRDEVRALLDAADALDAAQARVARLETLLREAHLVHCTCGGEQRCLCCRIDAALRGEEAAP